MSRIEQNPDGSFVRKLAPLEMQIIRRMYEEVSQRKEEAQSLRELMKTTTDLVSLFSDKIESFKAKMDDVQAKLSGGLFGSPTLATIDRNLTVTGFSESYFFKSTATSGPMIDGISRDLNPNFNAEFLQGKAPNDFVSASHRGKGGTAEHPLANDTTAGFFSPQEKAKLGAFGNSSEYATAGHRHGNATPAADGFQSKADKAALDELNAGHMPQKLSWGAGARIEHKTADGPDRLETDTFEVTQELKAHDFTFKGMQTDYVRVIGGGQDSTRYAESGIWLNGVSQLPRTRGWNVVSFDRVTRSVDWVRNYDTHGTAGTTNVITEISRLTNDLNALTHAKLVFIYGWDQPSFDNATGGATPRPSQAQLDAVIAALQRCGASKIVKNMPYRSSYALIGIPTIGEANGMEQFGYPNPVDISTLIFGGNPIGLGFSSGGVNVPAPNLVVHPFNSGSISDGATTADFIGALPDFEPTAAYVEIWNTSQTMRWTTLVVTTATPGVISYQTLEDGHARIRSVLLLPTGIFIHGENACYAIGSVGFTHTVSYVAKVTFHYGDYTGTGP